MLMNNCNTVVSFSTLGDLRLRPARLSLLNELRSGPIVCS